MKTGRVTDGVLELPFSGTVSLSRHCSHEGAKAALPKAGSQAWKVYLELKSRQMTMHELVERTGYPLSTICARLGFLRGKGLVEAAGTKKNPTTNVSNTVWAIRS